jgi:UDP-N-acetylmuramate dehydrogenase
LSSDRIVEQLRNILEESQIKIQEPMKNHTSFKIGGPADYYVRPRLEQVAPIAALCKKEGIPCQVIGNGSNLLVGDKGIRGLVLEIGSHMTKLEIKGKRLRVQAGASLAFAAQAAAKERLSGMEPLSGIPGTVGGAVVMNAGAYDGEVRDVLEEAKLLCKDGEIKTFSAKELDLSYRHSIITEIEAVVLEAVFTLRHGDMDKIKGRMAELKLQRETKQPLEYPSAGSTFKRPTGYFAGKLITDAGMKGFSLGGAQVSEKHAGFVINKENADAKDIVALIHAVQSKVKDDFGVSLEPEVKIIGEF